MARAFSWTGSLEADFFTDRVRQRLQDAVVLKKQVLNSCKAFRIDAIRFGHPGIDFGLSGIRFGEARHESGLVLHENCLYLHQIRLGMSFRQICECLFQTAVSWAFGAGLMTSGL